MSAVKAPAPGVSLHPGAGVKAGVAIRVGGGTTQVTVGAVATAGGKAAAPWATDKDGCAARVGKAPTSATASSAISKPRPPRNQKRICGMMILLRANGK